MEITQTQFIELSERLGRIETLLALKTSDKIHEDQLARISGLTIKTLRNLAAKGSLKKTGRLYSYKSYEQYNEVLAMRKANKGDSNDN